jgi:hypothetical protein
MNLRISHFSYSKLMINGYSIRVSNVFELKIVMNLNLFKNVNFLEFQTFEKHLNSFLFFNIFKYIL